MSLAVSIEDLRDRREGDTSQPYQKCNRDSVDVTALVKPLTKLSVLMLKPH